VDEHTISPAGDPFYAASRRQEPDPPHGCIAGIVYLGELVIGEDGEETEQLWPVLCRRCYPRDEE
jgi:hypothetical protein